MKKLLPVFLLAFIFLGCKKSEQITALQETAIGTKYNVKLTMADFGAATATMNAPGTKASAAIGDTLKNYANFLYYRIYNANGIFIRSVEQKSTSANFGTITEQLPTGTYSISLVASKAQLSFSSDKTVFNQGSYSPYSNTGWNDVFATSMSLKVANADLAMMVRLDRQVAGLRLVLEDAIPVDAAKITLMIMNDVGSFKFTGNDAMGEGYQINLDYPLTAADKGLKNKAFDSYIGNARDNISLIIRAYNSNNNLLIERNLINLKFEKNRRTVVTGDLFSAPTNPTAGFVVSLDPAWTPGTVKF